MSEADLLVGDSIDDYIPRAVDPDIWAVVGPQAREWAAALDVEIGSQAVQRLKPLAQYLAWRHEGGMNTSDAGRVFQADDIELFILRGCAHLASGTRATYRSALRTIGEHVAGFELACPDRTVPIAKPAPQTPYSPAEFAAVLSAIRGRSSAFQRHNAMALIILARGAGLGAGDIASLDGPDIEASGGGPVVIQLRGPRPRRVPVLANWERQATELAELSAGRPVFRSTRTQITRNDIGRFCERLSWTDAPGLSVTRLRITWVVEHLASGTPLRVLSEAAGVSPTSIARYAEFAPRYSEAHAIRVLRHPGPPP